jgi:DNA repair exonuclease SbcCD ATPase subunit
MQKDDNKPSPTDGDRRREDIERLKKALKEVAERLSSANDALKKAADTQRNRNERAAHAAEQLKKALEELRRRRETAPNQTGASSPGNAAPLSNACDSKPDAAQLHAAECRDCSEDSLPVFKGDFVSEEECRRLTNLPPITEDEIRNVRWDLFRKFFDDMC